MGAMFKKAKKTDIAAIEFCLADLDPNKDEKSEAAKARYLQQLETFEPKPTAIVDSGNGIQCLWRLAQRIELSSDSATVIEDVEARIKAIIVRLGAEPGTQNIDRILRLPGTTNLPNETKRKAGRVPCPTALIGFNGVSYALDAFPLPDGEHHARQETEDVAHGEGGDKLERIIRCGENGEFKGDRSRAVWWVVCEMLRQNCVDTAIVSTLLDRANKISDHVNTQAKPREYAERQVAEARAKITPTAQAPQLQIQSTTEFITNFTPPELSGLRTTSASFHLFDDRLNR